MSTSPLENEVELADDAPRALEPPRRRSSFSMMRDALLAVTRIAEDSTELVGASVREELERFRVEMARHALSVIALAVGGGLLTAGLALFLNALLDNWALTLVVFGALYVVVGLLLQRIGGGDADLS